jgi:hypothetical protein
MCHGNYSLSLSFEKMNRVFREGQTTVKIQEGVLLWFLEQWLPLVQFNNNFLYLPAELRTLIRFKTLIY